MKFLFVISIVILTSCYENNTCAPSYVGVFLIDTSLLIDPLQKSYILKNGWDTVKLNSFVNGSYKFNISNKILQDIEGNWYIKSDNIDGECFGYIKQKDLQNAIIRNPFDIMLHVNDTIQFNLPFRKQLLP